MEYKIKNLDFIPEKDRLDFEKFIQSSLAEDAKDEELRFLLISYVDEDATIDANEIYKIEKISNWKAFSAPNEYQENLGLISEFQIPETSHENEDPYPEIDNLYSIDETIEPEAIHSPGVDLLAQFGYSEPNQNNEDLNPFQNEDVIPIPSPNIVFDTTPAEQQSIDPDIPFDKGPVDDTGKTDVATSEDVNGEDIESEKETRTAPIGQAVSSGPHQSSNEDIISGAQALAASSLKLGSSALDLGSSVINITNKAITKTAALTGHTATATGKSLGTALTRLANRKRMMTGKDRELLTGLPSNSNVVDFRTRMEAAIAKKTTTDVERDIKLIADRKLAGKRNTLISIMKGVENGYPNGRLSSLEIAPGVTALSAITGAMSDDPVQRAMAQAILRGNGNIPDAANEIDFVTNEYQRLSDSLSAVTDMAEERGWSHEEITKQFVEPVQEWMAKREDEDHLLKSLASVQHEIDMPEISQEEQAERNRKFEEMIKELMKLISSLFNHSSQDQTKNAEASSSTTVTLSR